MYHTCHTLVSADTCLWILICPVPPSIALEGDGSDDLLFGGTIVGSGDTFPQGGVSDGDYFLRTDFIPDRLFQKSGNRWVRMEDETRQKWTSANRVLKNFINNDNVASLIQTTLWNLKRLT